MKLYPPIHILALYFVWIITKSRLKTLTSTYLMLQAYLIQTHLHIYNVAVLFINYYSIIQNFRQSGGIKYNLLCITVITLMTKIKII